MATKPAANAKKAELVEWLVDNALKEDGSDYTADDLSASQGGRVARPRGFGGVTVALYTVVKPCVVGLLHYVRPTTSPLRLTTTWRPSWSRLAIWCHTVPLLVHLETSARSTRFDSRPRLPS